MIIAWLFLLLLLLLYLFQAKIQGFLVQQWHHEDADTLRKLSDWILNGQIKAKEDIMEGGIDKASEALIKLFVGTNFGKQSVHINNPLPL